MGRWIEDSELIGKTIGNWTVEDRSLEHIKRPHFKCTCICGNTMNVLRYKIVKGDMPFCSGHNNRMAIGKKFNYLTILDYIKEDGWKGYKFKCQCECSNIVNVDPSDLAGFYKSGSTYSCGCMKPDIARQNNINRNANKYVKKDGYYVGYDGKGKKFLISEVDYELAVQNCWTISKRHNKEYAKTIDWRNGDAKISLHRHIASQFLPLTDDMQVDHINGITWDNRRENLRLATQIENSRNKLPRNTDKGKYTGIFKRKSGVRWSAQITLSPTNRVLLGLFNTKSEAIRARIDAEDKYFGEFSFLNSMKIAEEYAVEDIECELGERREIIKNIIKLMEE